MRALLLLLALATPALADNDDWRPKIPDTGPGAPLSDAPCKGDCMRAPGYLALDDTPGADVVRGVPVYRDHGMWTTYQGKPVKPRIVWRTKRLTAENVHDGHMMAAIIAPDAHHVPQGRLPTTERDAMTATYFVFGFTDEEGASLVTSCHARLDCNTKIPMALTRLLVSAEAIDDK